MQVIVAKTSGFCFGVNRAVESVYDNMKEKKLVKYGEIVHNKQLVEKLELEGVRKIENIDEIEALKDTFVVLRAHGVPKSVYTLLDDINVKYIDSTCPHVKKIHKIVEKHSNNNEKIIIIGSAIHPEIIGINGFCNDNAIIIESVEEAEKLEFTEEDIVCIVVQTTFNTNKYSDIIDVIKEKKWDKINVHNTICDATMKRQAEARLLSCEVDTMIVIGGKNSSNTRKLYEICKKNCDKTYHIQTKDDLELQNFNKDDKIGITAGASTPQYLIDEVVKSLQEGFGDIDD